MHRVVFPEVNAGWGHVDEVRYPPSGGLYPVPQHYTAAPRVLGERPSEDDLKTTHRQSYKPRWAAGCPFDSLRLCLCWGAAFCSVCSL